MGSSTQIALLVVPFSVIVGWATRYGVVKLPKVILTDQAGQHQYSNDGSFTRITVLLLYHHLMLSNVNKEAPCRNIEDTLATIYMVLGIQVCNEEF